MLAGLTTGVVEIAVGHRELDLAELPPLQLVGVGLLEAEV
jgi:hypothetical protein